MSPRRWSAPEQTSLERKDLLRKSQLLTQHGMRTPANESGQLTTGLPLQEPQHFNHKLYGSTADLLGSRTTPTPAAVNSRLHLVTPCKQTHKGMLRARKAVTKKRAHLGYFLVRAACSSRISLASAESESDRCRLAG